MKTKNNQILERYDTLKRMYEVQRKVILAEVEYFKILRGLRK